MPELILVEFDFRELSDDCLESSAFPQGHKSLVFDDADQLDVIFCRDVDLFLEKRGDCEFIGLESKGFLVVSPGLVDQLVDGLAFLAVTGSHLLHLEASDFN